MKSINDIIREANESKDNTWKDIANGDTIYAMTIRPNKMSKVFKCEVAVANKMTSSPVGDNIMYITFNGPRDLMDLRQGADTVRIAPGFKNDKLFTEIDVYDPSLTFLFSVDKDILSKIHDEGIDSRVADIQRKISSLNDDIRDIYAEKEGKYTE